MSKHTASGHSRRLASRLSSIRQARSFEAIFVILVIISIASLVGEFFLNVDEETARDLGRINMAIAWIFLADFFIGLIIAENNKQYFKSDWYLLLASIPIDEYLFGSLRIFRLIRAFRIYGITSRTLVLPEVRDKIAPRKDRD